MPQRRTWSRVPLRAKVRMEFADQRCFLSEWAVNLSPGGMFVRSDAPMTAGQRFSFEAALTPKGPRFGGVAEVLWVRREADRTARPAGFAVQFLELDDAGTGAIERLGEVFLASGVAAMQEELERLAVAWQQQRLDDEATGEIPAQEEPLQDTAVIPPPFGDEAAEDEDTAKIPREPAERAVAAAVVAAGAARAEPPPDAAAVEDEPAAPAAADSEGLAAPAAPERPPGNRGGWWVAAVVLVAGGAGFLAWRQGSLPPREPSAQRAAGGGAIVVPAAAAAPVGLPPAAAARLEPFRTVRDVTWSPTEEGLWVTLALEGDLGDGNYRHERMAEAPPEPTREVFHLLGASRPYPEPTLAVDAPQLERIRFGYHPAGAGNELRVVLDLASAEYAVAKVENAGSALRILLAPAGAGGAPAPSQAPTAAGTGRGPVAAAAQPPG